MPNHHDYQRRLTWKYPAELINLIISAIDLFCGAGGLTFGMRSQGIPVCAGFDSDPACQYAYTTNNPESKFIEADVAQLKGASLSRYFGDASLRILAGCAGVIAGHGAVYYVVNRCSIGNGCPCRFDSGKPY